MSFNDLERGVNEDTPLEPRNRGRNTHDGLSPFSREENPEFIRLAEQVGLHVFRINANVSTLQRLDASLRKTKYAENDELRHQL